MSRPTPPEAQIGARLRAARQARGLTLDQVAAATELTKGFISRLERDEVSPVGGLAGGRRRGAGPGHGRAVRPAGHPAGAGRHRAADRVRRAAGARDAADPGHPAGAAGHPLPAASPAAPAGPTSTRCARRWSSSTCVAGALDVVLADETIALQRGDALTFPGRTPHTWRNGSDDRAGRGALGAEPGTLTPRAGRVRGWSPRATAARRLVYLRGTEVEDEDGGGCGAVVARRCALAHRPAPGQPGLRVSCRPRWSPSPTASAATWAVPWPPRWSSAGWPRWAGSSLADEPDGGLGRLVSACNERIRTAVGHRPRLEGMATTLSAIGVRGRRGRAGAHR